MLITTLLTCLLMLAAYGEETIKMPSCTHAPTSDQEASAGKGYCSQPESDKSEKVDTLHVKKAEIYAQTIKLKEGPWCVAIDHDTRLGSRLFSLLAVQYGTQVVYVPLVAKHASPDNDFQGRIYVNVEAHSPFTVQLTFLPVLFMDKEAVDIEPCHCENPDLMLVLDGSHAHRLLSCHFEGGRVGGCEWTRTADDQESGADKSRWYTPPRPTSPSSYTLPPWSTSLTGFASKDDQNLYSEGFPVLVEGGTNQVVVSRHFLVSDWLTLKAEPGCLRLWLYTWGRMPAVLHVFLHQRSGEGERDKLIYLWTMPRPRGYFMTWMEEHILVEYVGQIKIIVEIRGAIGWPGSLVLDDVSAPGEACSGKNIVPGF